MQRKRILALFRRLRDLEERRAKVVDRLSADAPLLVGSISRVNRTCGKPTCHCAQEPGHPTWMLATTRAGRRRCQVVRQADVEDVRRRVQEHRNFGRGLRELQAIHRKAIELLRGLRENRNVPYE